MPWSKDYSFCAVSLRKNGLDLTKLNKQKKKTVWSLTVELLTRNMQNTTLDKKLQGFQLIAQEKLQAILCSIPGKKDLIIDPSIIKPLEHICAASWLKLKGIQRIFKLDEENAITRSSPDQVQLYMIRSNLCSFNCVLYKIKLIYKSQSAYWPRDNQFKFFHIICIPTCFTYFSQLLEKEGLFGVIGLHRYNWDFIHLDEGVLSMEMPHVFSSTFMRNDSSLLPSIAQSLRVLQIFCGHPELIVTFGEHSEKIVEMVDKLGPLPKSDGEDKNSDFSALMIMDRDRDFAAPLLTPAIYSALLLEVFSINAGILELEMIKNKIQQQKLSIFTLPSKKDNQQSNKSKTNAKKPTIRFSSLHDEIFAENRYKHFSAASSQIRQQAKTISMELQKLNNMKLDEMHDYVNRKLPKITDVKNKLLRHLNASEKVIEMLGSNFRRVQALEEDILNNVSRVKTLQDIDELLTTDGQKYNTLRLLALLHVCAGIKSDELTQFIRNYCNYFGLKHLTLFENLSQVGLLPPIVDESTTPINKTASKILSNIPLNIPKFQQTQFQANANRLKLLVSTDGADDPESSVSSNSSASSCASYVFNRLYIPLIAQLSSFLLKSANRDDFISKLAMVDGVQINGQSLKSYMQNNKHIEDKNFVLPLRKRQILVYVVGGITYAEIAACNLISKTTDAEIFVASDCILSGADLIAGAF